MTIVLVIEDTVSERELICGYLQEGGHKVIAAANGQEALVKMEQQIPEVIVTDLVMPDMSGLELCRRIKKNPLTSSIPIIACTSKNSDLDKLWALKQGIDVYLTKPFTRSDILDGISLVTRNK
jgi:two-component system, chemotaxis family, response regulator PixH